MEKRHGIWGLVKYLSREIAAGISLEIALLIAATPIIGFLMLIKNPEQFATLGLLLFVFGGLFDAFVLPVCIIESK